ncbi:LCP family protein [Solicola sp. PLA-1-18]|uniref:LCP family protein n=1 Tax=Solicola sp. PLA-1-18 TaxID=3380532 RepID=UPI003B769AF8
MSNASYDGAGKRRAPRRRSWVRRHWIVAILTVVLLVPTAGGAAYALMLNGKIGNVDRISVTQGLTDDERPDPAPGKALNILLLGADADVNSDGNNGGRASITADLKKAEWPSGKYRSDTMMVMHVSADRKDVQLVSIPRDSAIDIYDAEGEERGTDKANAAFSYYGPGGAIATVEQLTNLRIDHLAMIDWNGFMELSTALGGVRVYIPETTYDSSQKLTWKKGWTTLKGKRALKYVRTRHGLANGDFDRIARQQNFIRALMKKMLSQDTLTNPSRLNAALGAVTSNLTVDEDFTNGDIRGLAFAMRSLRSDDVTFLTTPTAGFATLDNGQSVVNVDEIKAKELFDAVFADDVASYLKQYPDEGLKSDQEVS